MAELHAPDVVYEIDARDEIAMVNDAWTAFATENAGTSLLPPGIIGRSVWDFIADPTTRLIYSRLFSRVRSRGRASTFTIRCDSPSVRRFLQMEVAASGREHGLKCTVRTLSLETRPVKLILDPSAPRSGSMILVCSWCKRVADGTGAWVEIDEAPALYSVFAEEFPPPVSHGMCDECFSAMMRSLDEEAGAGEANQSTA